MRGKQTYSEFEARVESLISGLQDLKASSRPSYAAMVDPGTSSGAQPQAQAVSNNDTSKLAASVTKLDSTILEMTGRLNTEFVNIHTAIGELKTGQQQLSNNVTEFQDQTVTQYNNLCTAVEGVIDPPDPDYISPDAPSDDKEVSRLMCDDLSGALATWGKAWLRLHKKLIPLHLIDANIHQILLEDKNSKPAGSPLPMQSTPQAATPQAATPQATTPAGATMSQLTSPIGPQTYEARPTLNANGLIKLPKMPKFDRIAADIDVRKWISKISTMLEMGNLDKSKWTAFATVCLEKVPLDYWDTHVTAVHATKDPVAISLLQDWPTFVAWCEQNLNVQDHKTRAFEQLIKLKQIGTVLQYKTRFEILAASADVPEHLQIQYFTKGLKDNIRKLVIIDPSTHTKFDKLSKLVTASLAVDATVGQLHADAMDTGDDDNMPSSSNANNLASSSSAINRRGNNHPSQGNNANNANKRQRDNSQPRPAGWTPWQAAPLGQQQQG